MLTFSVPRPALPSPTVLATIAFVLIGIVAAVTGAGPMRQLAPSAAADGPLPSLTVPAADPLPPSAAPVAAAGVAVPMGAIVPNGLLHPVAEGIVTSAFGSRWGRAHEGIDIAADTGAPVRAALGGVVVEAGDKAGYGNRIVIDHGAGGKTVYAHLSAIGVTVGMPVLQGAVVGLVGCSGSCTGPHLHFEVRVHEVPQNPLPLIP